MRRFDKYKFASFLLSIILLCGCKPKNLNDANHHDLVSYKQENIRKSEQELEDDRKRVIKFLGTVDSQTNTSNNISVYAAIFAMETNKKSYGLAGAAGVAKAVKKVHKGVPSIRKFYGAGVIESITRNTTQIANISTKASPFLSYAGLGAVKFLPLDRVPKNQIRNIFFYFNSYFPTKGKVPNLARKWVEHNPGLVHWVSSRKGMLTFLGNKEWSKLTANYDDILQSFLSIGVREGVLRGLRNFPEGEQLSKIIVDLNNLSLLFNSKNPIVQASAIVQLSQSGIEKASQLSKLHQQWQLSVYFKYLEQTNPGKRILDTKVEENLEDLLREAHEVKSSPEFIEWSSENDNSFFAYILSNS